MILVIFFLLAIVAAIMYFSWKLSAPVYRGPVSDHFDGKKFFNPAGYEAQGFRAVLKWMTSRKPGQWSQQVAAPGARPLEFIRQGIRLTFINHTTFLIQVNGMNILTDPVWSERVSPFTWVGPRRMRAPGIRLEDLPRIHAVLLSHNHYDHLDVQTMRVLFGAHHPKIVTPLGVKQFLDQEGITGATDLDWWQSVDLGQQIQIEAVPAQHFSGRGFADRDRTLWCGYVLHTPAGKIYFAGDTGYHSETFKTIGRKAGPFDAAIIPIGAYKPQWFMSPIHTSPQDAVRIHQDVQSKLSIASHFGTFPLADDGMDDPLEDLKKARHDANLNESAFITLREGEHIDLN